MKPSDAAYSMIGVALLAAIAVPFGAVGGLRFGIWHQVESVVLGLHASAATAALGLLVLAHSGRRARVIVATMQPLAALALLLGLWSLIAAPFVKLPGLSLFGAVETGEGAVWYLDLAVLVAAATIVKHQRIWSAVIPASALSVTVAIAALQQFAPADSGLIPYSYTDYLAFHGLFTATILIFWLRRPFRLWAWAGLALACGAILLSRNLAALLMVGVAGPILWLGLRWGSGRLSIGQLRLVGAGIAAGTVIVVTSAPFLAAGFTTTLDTRARLSGVAWAAIAERPMSLLTGFGWGATTDLNFEYLHMDTGTVLSPSVVAGPTGEILHFHSHNAFVEALISTGAIGLALAIAMAISLPLVVRDRMMIAATVFAAIFAGLSAMWFQLAASLPLMAVAFAGFSYRGPSQWWRVARRRVGVWALASMAAATGLQSFAAFVEYDVARRSQIDPWTRDTIAPSTDCRLLMHDYGRGGRHLAFVAGNLRNRLIALADAAISVSPETAAVLDAYICATDQWMTHPRLLQLAATSLGARTDLAFRLWDPVYNPLRDRALGDWEAQVLRLLDETPERTDAARHYFYWRMAQGDVASAVAFADTILARRQDDPAGLWFKGLALSRMPARRAEARNILVDALKRGAVKMMDVDHDFLASLGITIVFPKETSAP